MKYLYLLITIVLLGFSIMNYIESDGSTALAGSMAFSAFLAFQCCCLCEK